MVDKKISELNPIVQPAPEDVFPIVDITAVETKKITFSDLAAALATGSNLSIATEQITSGITQVGDNVTIDLSVAIPDAYTAIMFVTRNGQMLMPNGNANFPGSSWSLADPILTVYNADAGEVFLVQYLYE